MSTTSKSVNARARSSKAGVWKQSQATPGHVYISQREPNNGKIYLCTFRDCTHTIETLAARPLALAVSPLDGNLYASTEGKSSIEVYNPRTGNLVMRIPEMSDLLPGPLAIEP